MWSALNRAEHYRDLAKRYLRLAAIGASKNRNHYLRIAVQYSTLAEAEEVSTPRRSERRSVTQKRSNRQMSNLTRDGVLAAVHPIDDDSSRDHCDRRPDSSEAD